MILIPGKENLKPKEMLIQGKGQWSNCISSNNKDWQANTCLIDTSTSVLRARFLIMEEIHKRHNIEMDPITQDDDDNFTQGTAVSRSTIFTNATQNTYAITQEDIDAFQRAIEHKNSDLCYDLGNLKKQHRIDEDKMQKEILELQGKTSAINNGKF